MTIVNMHEAKTQLSKLVKRSLAGEQIIIANAGEPQVELTPVVKQRAKRILGRDVGKAWISPHFDDPLPEFEEYM